MNLKITKSVDIEDKTYYIVRQPHKATFGYIYYYPQIKQWKFICTAHGNRWESYTVSEIKQLSHFMDMLNMFKPMTVKERKQVKKLDDFYVKMGL